MVEKSFVFSRVLKPSKCRQLGGDQLTTRPFSNTNIRHGRKQVRRNDTEINQGALFQGVSVPGALMYSFVLKKCVHYAQSIGGTELQ